MNETKELLAEQYLHYLLQEAAKSDRQAKRLVPRLDNLEKNCSETADITEDVYMAKKRMYSVGISYYASRADYCYRRAELEFKKQEQ